MTFRHVAAALGLALGIALLYSPHLGAQAGVQGRWTTLPYLMPINPVHVALMHNGKVLIVAGSGNVATETNFQAAVWDPESGRFSRSRSPGTCSATAWWCCRRPGVRQRRQPAVRPVLTASRGTRCSTRRPAVFTDVENMAHGRWYPTVTTLGDGRVMTFSGLRETGGTNTAVEIYTRGVGVEPGVPAGWTPPLYPRMHLMPDGRSSTPAPEPARGSSIRRRRRGRPSCHHQLQRHADLRHVGAAAADAGERLQAARDDLRRRQPGDRDDGNHRPRRRRLRSGSTARRCRSRGSR